MSKRPYKLRVMRAFLRYRQVCELDRRCVAYRRDGRWGIAVDGDEWARQYQQRVAWRKERLEAFFLGVKADPRQRAWHKEDGP